MAQLTSPWRLKLFMFSANNEVVGPRELLAAVGWPVPQLWGPEREGPETIVNLPVNHRVTLSSSLIPLSPPISSLFHSRRAMYVESRCLIPCPFPGMHRGEDAVKGMDVAHVCSRRNQEIGIKFLSCLSSPWWVFAPSPRPAPSPLCYPKGWRRKKRIKLTSRWS